MMIPSFPAVANRTALPASRYARSVTFTGNASVGDGLSGKAPKDPGRLLWWAGLLGGAALLQVLGLGIQIERKPAVKETNVELTAPVETPSLSVLTAEEAEALSMVSKLKGKSPMPVVIVADTGAYHDDEGAFVVASQLMKMGLLDTKAVIANFYPSPMRARLTKGTFEQLGHPDIPVGAGSPCGQTTVPKPEEFNVDYLAAAERVQASGAALLKQTLEKADDNSLTLLLLSGMTDASQLLETQPALFKQKVKQVVIMGGVIQDAKTGEVVLDKDGLMTPNTAFNNNVDMPSALTLYRKLQQAGIPMVIVTDEAAFSNPVTPKFYEAFAATGHPVGKRLRNYQRHEMEEVWTKANLAAKDPRREGMEGSFDRGWFLKTYCKKPETASQVKAGEPIWSHVDNICLFDPISVLACLDDKNGQLFHPETVTVNGVTHRIIGLTPQAHGVSDPTQLKTLMSALGKSTLRQTSGRVGK